MIDKTELFTITLLDKADDEKVLLIKRGDVPAKEEQEADSVLTSSNPEDAEAIAKIIASIPVFASSEPGSEESVTETLDNFENRYGFSFEEIEDLTGVDVDDDHEEDEVDHLTDHEGMAAHEDSFTDPTEMFLDKHSDTAPGDFHDYTESAGEDKFNDPTMTLNKKMDEDQEYDYDGYEVLEERASSSEVVSKLVSTINSSENPLSAQDITGVFNGLGIFDVNAKLHILTQLAKSNSAVFYVLNGDANDVSLTSPTKMMPVEYVKLEDPRQAISQIAGQR
jgi:hypothetical protein